MTIVMNNLIVNHYQSMTKSISSAIRFSESRLLSLKVETEFGITIMIIGDVRLVRVTVRYHCTDFYYNGSLTFSFLYKLVVIVCYFNFQSSSTSLGT
ncbi:hypothetical protein EB796_011152 [Bugula neritina]|uniref:Uncharacterized protein n=1 Tax=Bugula neritina TaxID=10212 RepID=A0A7J7JXT2_BUGNE|nr:hypothetical protein EB796_011152 [Bugula neritina]